MHGKFSLLKNVTPTKNGPDQQSGAFAVLAFF